MCCSLLYEHVAHEGEPQSFVLILQYVLPGSELRLCKCVRVIF